MDRVARDKLKWKCRRGLLEPGLALEKFLQREAIGLRDAQFAQLNRVPDVPYNDLWDIVSGRSDRYDPALEDAVVRLRMS